MLNFGCGCGYLSAFPFTLNCNVLSSLDKINVVTFETRQQDNMLFLESIVQH